MSGHLCLTFVLHVSTLRKTCGITWTASSMSSPARASAARRSCAISSSRYESLQRHAFRVTAYTHVHQFNSFLVCHKVSSYHHLQVTNEHREDYSQCMRLIDMSVLLQLIQMCGTQLSVVSSSSGSLHLRSCHRIFSTCDRITRCVLRFARTVFFSSVCRFLLFCHFELSETKLKYSSLPFFV